MKALLRIIRPPKHMDPRLQAAHHIWMALSLTGMGCCIGGLSLIFAANAGVKLQLRTLSTLRSYIDRPLILLLNLLPAVLLIWLFYFLSRRAWVGFLGSFFPTIGVSLVNYYKIRLRGDPFLASDLRLAGEARGFVDRYTLDLTPVVWLGLLCFIMGLLFSIFFMTEGLRGWRERTFGALSCLALIGVSYVSLYSSPQLYEQANNTAFTNQWSSVEAFLSKGCVYPFLYSIQDMFPEPPEGYDEERAAKEFASYTDSDIPAEKKVSVMGIMMEAFADLTDFESMAVQEKVAEVYAPWHALEEQSVSGELLTNIFAGGTVDTEWAFLTGYSEHMEFHAPTDSYVWYFRDQGYQTFGGHPGYSWVYNRQNVNRYLGLEEYWFAEEYGFNPDSAMLDSDPEFTEAILSQLKERIGDGPCFSFNVTIQNHGPYELTPSAQNEYVTPAGTGMSEESCNILNNYLSGISGTIQSMVRLTRRLERLDEPVVLVLFGDHKPWAGNGDSVYIEMGAYFYVWTPEGFYNYFSTPYLIWANSAAKEVLGNDFVGDGGDFSPCFLMPKVFDLCGWEGPGFMKLSREMRAITPMVHEDGLFWIDGGPVDALEETAQAFFEQFRRLQYYREHNIRR